MLMAAIVLIGPSGYRKPRAVSTPPPNSDALAPMAHGVPGFIPSDSSQPAVPCSPKPPNQPKDFCEPCPLNSPPTVSRKISNPRSLIMSVSWSLLVYNYVVVTSGYQSNQLTCQLLVCSPFFHL